MPAPKITSVQVRRGLKAEWDSVNPQLLDGEIGYETDTYRLKIGRRDGLGRLIHWNDLRYQAPFSGLEKPNYPQDGDFWVEDSTKDLYYFDGEVWRKILSFTQEGDLIIDGNLNMENGCVTGDLKPCKDITFKLGTPEKRWTEIHLGDSVSPDDDFAITIGESSDPDSELYRLQLNGEDIALRSDFGNYTTKDLPLYTTFDPDGDPTPVPRLYQLLDKDVRSLPGQPGTGTDGGNLDLGFNEIVNGSQQTANTWYYVALQWIVGYDESVPEGQGRYLIEPPETMDFWNKSAFRNEFEASKGVRTPVTPENITDYDAAPAAASYFHKADGSISDRVPLNQSYWVDVPRLTNTRRR